MQDDQQRNFADINATLFRDREELKARIEALRTSGADEGTSSRSRLNRALRKYDDVTAAIIDANYGLVRSYARRFAARATPEDIADFESSAIVGLMRAIETFDPNRGVSFSTWAWKPIQREVLKAVREAEFRTLNGGDFERRPRILRAQTELTDKLGRRPTPDEIAAACEMSVDHVMRVIDAPKLWSLDTPMGDEDATSLGDLIGSDGSDFTDELSAASFVEALSRYGIPALDERELFVLTRRFGLDSEPAQSLAAVGEAIGLSREAIRQVESKAIARLQHPVVLRKILLHGAQRVSIGDHTSKESRSA